MRIRATVTTGAVRDGMLSRKGIMIVQKMLAAAVIAWALFAQNAVAADAQQAYQEAADALYNLDFSIAQHAFEGLTHQYPDNPDYWNALASCVWFKILYDQQKLNIES